MRSLSLSMRRRPLIRAQTFFTATLSMVLFERGGAARRARPLRPVCEPGVAGLPWRGVERASRTARGRGPRTCPCRSARQGRWRSTQALDLLREKRPSRRELVRRARRCAPCRSRSGHRSRAACTERQCRIPAGRAVLPTGAGWIHRVEGRDLEHADAGDARNSATARMAGWCRRPPAPARARAAPGRRGFLAADACRLAQQPLGVKAKRLLGFRRRTEPRHNLGERGDPHSAGGLVRRQCRL